MAAGKDLQDLPAGIQDDGNGKMVLPQLNRLHEAFKRKQIPSSASSSQDQQPNRPTPIPTQRRLTQQLIKLWGPFKALRQRFNNTRLDEQRQLQHSTRRDVKRRPAARRCGDSELSSGSSREPELGL